MWPSASPAGLYQPINNEDDEQAFRDRESPTRSNSLWQPDASRSTLCPTAPIKQESLLGGATLIDQHLLLGGAGQIRREMLLDMRREQTYQPSKVEDVEQECIDLDNPKGSLLPGAKVAKLRQISMKTAIFLTLFLAAILCLGTAGFVFGTSAEPAKVSPNGGVTGQAHP